MATKIDDGEQQIQADELALHVQRLTNTVEVIQGLVKTLYDQQVAQERSIAELRRLLSSYSGRMWQQRG